MWGEVAEVRTETKALTGIDPSMIAAEDLPQVRPTTRSNGANKRPTSIEHPTSRHGVGELPDKPPRIRLTFEASGPL